MKKIQIQFLALAALFIIVLNSCDYIAPPYLSDNAGNVVDTTTYFRKVLIEDYTGSQCVNCPNAAKELARLDTVYKYQIIPIAVHCSSFADSSAFPPFNFDLKTSEGTEWDNFFTISNFGLPKGMVNRKYFPSNGHRLEWGKWGDYADSIVQTKPDANIKIVNAYDNNTRTISTDVESKFLNDLTGTYKLCVVYVEDSIIKAQSMPSGPPNLNYVHMHALRGTLNGTWGETLSTNPLNNSVVNKQYSLTIRPDAVPENCKVVAFIYNDATKEVVQADEKHFK